MKKSNYFEGVEALVNRDSKRTGFLSIPTGIVFVPAAMPFFIRR